VSRRQGFWSIFPRLLVPIALIVVFLRFVVANGAPERGTGETVMTCVVAGGTPDNSSFEAASRIRGAGYRYCGKGQSDKKTKSLH
jgi:hypothetical protein